MTVSRPLVAPEPVRRGRGIVALLIGAVAIAILISLGVWQLQRLAWKEGLIATIGQRIDATPVPLATVLADGKSVEDQEYTPVSLRGVFDHAGERMFFATHDGDAGYYVYTPLLLDSGDYVFVNRGFVPFELKDPARRPQGEVPGEVTVNGLLRPTLPSKPSWLVPDNDPAKNIFYWKDIKAMRETAGLPANAHVLDVFVDADKTANPGGLPIGGVTIIDLPNDHLQYAFTWFGLAAALAGVMAASFMQRRKSAASATTHGGKSSPSA